MRCSRISACCGSARPGGGNGRPPVAIHDPCFYGRYLKLSEGPRQVLGSLGLDVYGSAQLRRVHLLLRRPGGVGVPGPEPGDSRRGGRRSCKASGAPVVTFCPICLANLLKAGLPVEDLASLVDRC